MCPKNPDPAFSLCGSDAERGQFDGGLRLRDLLVPVLYFSGNGVNRDLVVYTMQNAGCRTPVATIRSLSGHVLFISTLCRDGDAVSLPDSW
jgi:hypothetical protein